MAQRVLYSTNGQDLNLFSEEKLNNNDNDRDEYGYKYLQVLESLGDKEPADVGREVCQGVSPTTTVHWQHLGDDVVDDNDDNGNGDADDDDNEKVRGNDCETTPQWRQPK